MTEPTFAKRDLTVLLNEALQQANFLVPAASQFPGVPSQCSAEQLRHAYYANSRFVRSLILRAQPKIPDRPLGDLTMVLRKHLENYVVDDRIGNGLALIVGGVTVVRPLADYAQDLVRAAAFLGPERVAHLVTGWARDQPLPYHTCMVLSGLSIDKPMFMDGGIRFSTLSKSSDTLANELPFLVDFDLGIMNLAGATKVAIECQDSPVLFRPGPLPETQTTTYGSSSSFLYSEFCEALSLAYNHRVSWVITWRDFGDLTIFGNGTGSGYTTGPDTSSDFRTYPGEPPMSQEQLDYAGSLLTKRRNNPNPALDIPLHRWMSSKRPSASLADRFIDLRIALESLYLKEGGPELSFRLATHGAWHLGANFYEREEYRKTLRDAYNAASKAVHTGMVDSTEKNRQLLAYAQDLCRLGILKRLNEGTAPDWNALILGKELDTTSANDNETRP